MPGQPPKWQLAKHCGKIKKPFVSSWCDPCFRFIAHGMLLVSGYSLN
jgi:hypothetical protein